MPTVTKEYCTKFAKSVGDSLTKTKKGYELKTCYGTYHLETLKEVERKITKDHQRLQGARF